MEVLSEPSGGLGWTAEVLEAAGSHTWRAWCLLPPGGSWPRPPGCGGVLGGGGGLLTRCLLSHEVRPEAQPLVPDPAAAAGARRPVRVRRGRLHLRGGGPRLPQRSDRRGALRPCHQLLGLRGPAQEGGKEAPRGTPPRFTEEAEAGPGTQDQDQDQSPLASTSCALSLGGGPLRLSQRVGRDPFPSPDPSGPLHLGPRQLL